MFNVVKDQSDVLSKNGLLISHFATFSIVYFFDNSMFLANAPTPHDLKQYQETIDRTNELLNAVRKKESLCDFLVQFDRHPNNFERIRSCDFRLAVLFLFFVF